MRCLLIAAILLMNTALAKPVQDFLPEGSYTDAIPQPQQVLGWQLGEWHARHDQLVNYYAALASGSPRVAVETVGYSHEQRPLQLVTITHPENFERLEQMRQAHIENAADAPLVLWFGYSVHGNESSGANAAPAFAWYLAANEDPAFIETLRNTIILMEPVVNPDGLSRFAQWANMHKSLSSPVADRANREHQEVWPGGRFNHYWFDLNRDWLLLTHPESQARIAQYQKWRPHVLTDFHEMGSDATYFFQPGVPERKHPLTPEENVELTAKLGAFHARALDQAGELYYSEESFDDFYYGKGSTYPDVQGTIGILFEQASSRGHLMATVNGSLSFAQTIQNQVTTSLSTLQGSFAIADELKAHRKTFFADAAREAAADRIKAWVFGDATDPTRSRRLAEIISQHGIEVYELASRHRQNDDVFEPGSSWIVPTQQRQYRLIKSMFETRTEFADSTFYDVSAWTMPLAFGVPFQGIGQVGNLQGDPIGDSVTSPAPEQGAYAYALAWSDYNSPSILAKLLAEEIKVRAATRSFVAVTSSGPQRFERGTLIIQDREQQLFEVLGEQAGALVALRSGLTPDGIDLGSPSMRVLEPVRPLIVVGPGVSPLEVGDIWHLLDTRVGQPLTMVDKHRLQQTDLSDYSHVVLADGNYRDLPEGWIESLYDWVNAGGVLVAQRRASAWVTEQGLHQRQPNDDDPIDAESSEQEPSEDARLAYGDYSNDFSQTVVGGAIAQGEVDITHPLAYGYSRTTLPLLMRGTTFFQVSDNPYETVIAYSEQPVLAGFIGEARVEQLAGSAALLADRVGQGAVIRFNFNPNFRGVWYGTNKLFLNALYFGQLIDATPVPDTEKRL